jgi:hypothetical protein
MADWSKSVVAYPNVAAGSCTIRTRARVVDGAPTPFDPGETAVATWVRLHKYVATECCRPVPSVLSNGLMVLVKYSAYIPQYGTSA